MTREIDSASGQRVTGLEYPRVLLKLSGEALAGEKGFAFDFATVARLADEVASVVQAPPSVS